MIVAIVTFRLSKAVTREEISATFQSTAPRYLGMPGLLRKNYWVADDGLRAGGIYVWESRERAEAVYNAEWRAGVAAKYGSEPEIAYYDSPVMVDNTAGAITLG
jgi:hypothetical protein